jgi:5-methylcytosine-specific restriction enzyme A
MTRLRSLAPALRQADMRAARPEQKQADPIYATADHRAWRAEVIRRAGGMCQAPGCNRSGVRLFADHVVELRDGGAATDLGNGQALCGACHSLKTAAARAQRQRT